MKNLLSAFLLFAVLMGVGCGQKGKAKGEINDLIPIVNLVAGDKSSIIISDLFYAENYNVTFLPNENLNVVYSPNSLEIKIETGKTVSGFTNLDFIMKETTYSIPINVQNIPKTKFQFKPKKSYKSITLFGQFNSWNRENLIMTDEDGDGKYEIEIPLEPGKYEYKFFADGEELLDPTNPNKIGNGIGGINSFVVIEKDEAENNYLHLIGSNNNEAATTIAFNLDSINETNIIALLDNEKIPSEQILKDGRKIEISVKKKELSGKNHLRVFTNSNGIASNVQTLVFVDGKPAGSENAKFTWYDGIIYSLLTDRFNNGDETNDSPVEQDSVFDKANYRGGDIQGVINKIKDGYFTDLGVNVLWISPLNVNPDLAYREYPEPHRWFTGYHGYWPIEPDKVQRRFGTLKLVKEFVKVAHEHNLKVLLDFVSNHVHEQHPYFQEHPEWFGTLELPDGRLNLRHWDEFRLTTWFEPYMPSFDYVNSKEAITAMTDNAVWWLKETGADGFRHDAVKHVPNEFWRELTRKLKAEIAVPKNTEIYQIGETFGDYDLVSSYVNNGQLSSQFNFNLYNTAQAAFIDPEFSFEHLDVELKKTANVYGTLHLMGNIMDSHDKNRFMAYADGDLTLDQWSAVEEGWDNPPKVDDPENYKKAILYMAYMNSISGLPVIYYGSEFGMTGATDPDNRRLMRFGEDLSNHEKEMLSEVQKIINLRKDHPALRYGDLFTLQADKKIFSYIRSDLNERILVILNKDAKSAKVNLNLPSFYNISEGWDLINSEKFSVSDNAIEIDVASMGYRIIRLK